MKSACEWLPKGIHVNFVCFGVFEADPDAKGIDQGGEVTFRQSEDAQAISVFRSVIAE
tara:strand:- start:286 stop:459 length:174 start_codon:yes stop_codon:yes gene_type:complete